MGSLLERYSDRIAGVLSCFDRVLIQGTLPGLCYPEGMTSYLRCRGIRIFDYPQWAKPLCDQIRDNALRLAKEAGIEIEFVRKTASRKDDRIRAVLDKRGTAPGLVHILSAMESCYSYQPWHDKPSGRTYLKPDSGKCLHYYFYFIDPDLGLCYLRVPTWCPFRLQCYFNGHNRLSKGLDRRGIGHKMMENAFVSIDDFDTAQRLADTINVRWLQRRLDAYAKRFCPVLRSLGVTYHWSLLQAEYATDLIFRRQSDLAVIYDTIVQTAIHAVKPASIATFLGRKLDGNYRDEVGNDFSTRILGTRIKHQMGPASIKMYDKRGLVLRIETTINDVSFFKHYRRVEQRNGESCSRVAPMKKSIYSLPALASLLAATNRRYLDFISALDDREIGIRALNKLSSPASENGRRYQGINFFSPDDLRLCEIIVRGEFILHGFRCKNLRDLFTGKSPSQISRFIKRLRIHGVIKRVAQSYKYYLTELGRRVVVAGLKLRTLFLIPALAQSVRA